MIEETIEDQDVGKTNAEIKPKQWRVKMQEDSEAENKKNRGNCVNSVKSELRLSTEQE